MTIAITRPPLMRFITTHRCIDEQEFAADAHHSARLCFAQGDLREAGKYQRLQAWHHQRMRERLEKLLGRE